MIQGSYQIANASLTFLPWDPQDGNGKPKARRVRAGELHVGEDGF
jgi:hypothetical protein